MRTGTGAVDRVDGGWHRLKITEIRTAVVQGNYDWTFIRVYTDQGVVGLGESFFAPGLTGIIRQLATVLIGQDARDISPPLCQNAAGRLRRRVRGGHCL